MTEDWIERISKPRLPVFLMHHIHSSCRDMESTFIFLLNGSMRQRSDWMLAMQYFTSLDVYATHEIRRVRAEHCNAQALHLTCSDPKSISMQQAPSEVHAIELSTVGLVSLMRRRRKRTARALHFFAKPCSPVSTATRQAPESQTRL